MQLEPEVLRLFWMLQQKADEEKKSGRVKQSAGELRVQKGDLPGCAALVLDMCCHAF